MSLISAALCLFFLTLFPWASCLRATEISELPAVIDGKLANGFRYVIFPRVGTVNGVSLRFVVQAGSLDEREAERGDAHLLEHLAVSSVMAPLSKDSGHAFGLSAFTHFCFTRYLIDLNPDQVRETSEALLRFRRICDGIPFTKDHMDANKRVVRREFHSASTLAQRVYFERLAVSYGGTGIPERLPKGLLDRIDDVTPTRVQNFHLRCYQPDRMTLVVVGNVDPSEMVQLVERTFGSLGNTESGAAPVLPRPVPPTPLRSKVIVVRGQDYAEATLFAIPSTAIQRDATKQWKTEFAESVIAGVLGRRLAKSADMKKLGATRGERSDPPDPHFREYSFSMQAPPNQWPFLATQLATEVRRLCTENIPVDELADVVAAQLAAWRASREEFLRQPEHTIADEMVTEITAGKSWIFPACRCNEAEAYSALFTPTEARIVAQTLFNEELLSLFLTIPTAGIEEDALLVAYRQGVP